MAEKSIIETIKRFTKALSDNGIAIERIILYGSSARGMERLDSDIDIAVVSRDFGKDRIEEGMRLFRIAGKIDPRLEPVPISTESYENDTWLPIIYEIRENGIEFKDSIKTVIRENIGRHA